MYNGIKSKIYTTTLTVFYVLVLLFSWSDDSKCSGGINIIKIEEVDNAPHFFVRFHFCIHNFYFVILLFLEWKDLCCADHTHTHTHIEQQQTLSIELFFYVLFVLYVALSRLIVGIKCLLMDQRVCFISGQPNTYNNFEVQL